MQYREMGRTGDKVSILGYGCMRLKRGEDRVDEKRAERLVRTAIDSGVNYVDTAYLYLGNETLVGNILSDGYRDKVLLATKLPPVQVTAQKDMEKLQEEVQQNKVEASAGGGAVTVVVTGKKELVSMEIKPEVVDPEDIEMLQDLIMAAVNEALRKADEMVTKEMSKITGGLNLPGGLF
jgi:DNA-binding YbaB/EbfC family protein